MKTRDFTMQVYGHLLDALKAGGHSFRTITEHVRKPDEDAILLRHDVDDRKLHSLAFAQLQHQKGIVGTYYFRMVPQSYDKDVIRAIHDLGHEVGYHYEELDLCNGDPEKGIQLFQRNLEQLRSIVPITTICMHGSPRSPYDNKDLWKHYDYRDHGIIGEPYFDLDFARMAYFTDTGRRWDGGAFSVRDRVSVAQTNTFHHTQEMIDSAGARNFPARAMLNFHPQRWTDAPVLWWRDRCVQSVKNLAKYGLIKWRDNYPKPTL